MRKMHGSNNPHVKFCVLTSLTPSIISTKTFIQITPGVIRTGTCIPTYNQLSVKIKFTLEQAMKARRGRRGIAVTFNLGVRWGRGYTPGPL